MMKTLSDIEAEDLDEYYFSAPVKRMIWQTILIIKELVKVLGCEPDRIFVEMTRRPDERKCVLRADVKIRRTIQESKR